MRIQIKLPECLKRRKVCQSRKRLGETQPCFDCHVQLGEKLFEKEKHFQLFSIINNELDEVMRHNWITNQIFTLFILRASRTGCAIFAIRENGNKFSDRISLAHLRLFPSFTLRWIVSSFSICRRTEFVGNSIKLFEWTQRMNSELFLPPKQPFPLNSISF